MQSRSPNFQNLPIHIRDCLGIGALVLLFTAPVGFAIIALLASILWTLNRETAGQADRFFTAARARFWAALAAFSWTWFTSLRSSASKSRTKRGEPS